MRSEFATSDPEVGQAVVAAAYADNRLRVSGSVENYRMSQRRIDIGEIRFDNYDNTMVSEYDFEPLGCAIVFRVFDGRVQTQTQHVERRASPGDVLLCAQPDQMLSTRVIGARAQMIGLDLSLLQQVTEEPAVDVVRRFRTTQLEPAAARRWVRTVDFLTDTVLADDGAAVSPLVLGAAGRLLAATLVTVFDPDAQTGQPADRVDATPEAVRRAVAYCEANPDLDIGVVDIARAARVSVRTLQIAFRRHVGATPTGYLRRVRMDRAHQELLDADPGRGDTVTAIAARWGFAQPGRFAVRYQRAYGQKPSLTLHG